MDQYFQESAGSTHKLRLDLKFDTELRFRIYKQDFAIN